MSGPRADLAFRRGAGDGNRTRTISLGIRQIWVPDAPDVGGRCTASDPDGPSDALANGPLTARVRRLWALAKTRSPPPLLRPLPCYLHAVRLSVRSPLTWPKNCLLLYILIPEGVGLACGRLLAAALALFAGCAARRPRLHLRLVICLRNRSHAVGNTRSPGGYGYRLIPGIGRFGSCCGQACG
jgi:hypothetical protein